MIGPQNGGRSRTSFTDAEELIQQALIELSPSGRPFAGELFFNKAILKTWKNGALGILDLTREEFNNILVNKVWHYDKQKHQWVCSSAHVAPDPQLTF